MKKQLRYSGWAIFPPGVCAVILAWMLLDSVLTGNQSHIVLGSVAVCVMGGISFWLAYSRVVVEPDQLTQIRPVLPNRSVRFDEVQTLKYERSKIRLITDSEEASIPMDMKNALEHSHQILSTIPETAEHIGKADVIEDVRRGRKPTFRESLPTAAPVFAVIGVMAIIAAGVTVYVNVPEPVSVEQYHVQEVSYQNCLYQKRSGLFLETPERRYFISEQLFSAYSSTQTPQTSAKQLCRYDRATVWLPSESARDVRGIETPSLKINPSVGAELARENRRMVWWLAGAFGAIGFSCVIVAIWGYREWRGS